MLAVLGSGGSAWLRGEEGGEGGVRLPHPEGRAPPRLRVLVLRAPSAVQA